MCQAGTMTAASDPLECISALTLVVHDMATSVAFYEALGFRLLSGGPEAPFTTFQVGTGYLNLQLDAAGPRGDGIWGRAILWVHDVDEMFARARRAGFEPTTAPTDAPWGERYFHIRDPDGHELSFARPLAR
jgi:catechol 2,3-dioxygenase-like lactoylglutathione lyase family enzyme